MVVDTIIMIVNEMIEIANIMIRIVDTTSKVENATFKFVEKLGDQHSTSSPVQKKVIVLIENFKEPSYC